MTTPTARLRAARRRIVRRLERFTEEARACLVEAALWLADRLRGPAGEIVLDDSDLEVLTPWSLRRLEVERPELAFPRRPLAEAVVRRGWVTVGQATILGLGSPILRPGQRPNVREVEPPAGAPAWARAQGVEGLTHR